MSRRLKSPRIRDRWRRGGELMRPAVLRCCAIAMLAGLLGLGDAASGLAGLPAPLAAARPPAPPLPLPAAAGARIPDVGEEVTLDGYGVQVARAERFLPASRPRRPSQPDLELLMRHGDLLDALVEAPILRLDGSATLQLPAARSMAGTRDLGEALGIVPILPSPALVPEPGTGAFLSVGLLATALHARGRRVGREREFTEP